MVRRVHPKISGQFLRQTTDALRHYYDSAHLAGHPLLSQLKDTLGADQAIAVQRLRRMLLDAVERLRPAHGTPADSPAWRPYRILHDRYILGKDLGALEADLGLSRRQIQRDQRKAVAAVAIALLAGKAHAAGHSQPGPQDSITQEISRIASEEQVFDALPELENALQPIRAFAQQRRVELVARLSPPSLRVLGNQDLLRQFLVSALSLVVRLASSRKSAVCVEKGASGIICTVYPWQGSVPDEHSLLVQFPEPLLVLAEANGVTLTQEANDDLWRLLIEFRVVPRSYTVAIVEDNKDLVRLYSRYLSSRGYRLVEVADSGGAVERIAEIAPDAVVLDLMMSKVDGWQILQRLQGDSSLRHIPVAVCSVLNEPELAKSLGARAYLRKPVRPAELLECLTGLLDESDSAEAGSSPMPR